MNEIIREYLEWKGTYAPRASVNYKIWLDYFIKVCGIKPLEQYVIGDCVKYQQWLKEHYNPCSVQYATTVLKNFFSYCKMHNLNCLSPAFIRLPRSVAKSHRAITEAEFLKLAAIVPSKGFINLRDLLLVKLL